MMLWRCTSYCRWRAQWYLISMIILLYSILLSPPIQQINKGNNAVGPHISSVQESTLSPNGSSHIRSRYRQIWLWCELSSAWLSKAISSILSYSAIIDVLFCWITWCDVMWCVESWLHMISCDVMWCESVWNTTGPVRARLSISISKQLESSSSVSFNREVIVKQVETTQVWEKVRDGSLHESISLSRSGWFAGSFTSLFGAADFALGAFAPFTPFAPLWYQ